MKASLLYAWGANSHGQLGTGDQIDRHEPTHIQSEEVTLVSGGGGHSVIVHDSKVYTCGLNTQGELGRTDDPFHFRPVPFDFGAPITSVACGWDFTLVLTKDGTVYTWGSNNYGQLGLGDVRKFTDLPCAIRLPPIRSIAAGLRHSVAVTTSGQVYVWGFNRRKQLGPILVEGGQEVPTVVSYPMLLSPAAGLNQISAHQPVTCSAGAYHSAVVSDDGSLAIWGDLTYLKPQRNNSDTSNYDENASLWLPRQLFGGVPIVQIVSGWSHLVARTDIGTVFTWGRSHLRQLARQQPCLSGDHPIAEHDPIPCPVYFPTSDGQSPRITQLAAGAAHTLATDTFGQLYVWGWNEHGMCGLPEPDGATAPTTRHSALWAIEYPRRISLTPSNDESTESAPVLSIGAGYGHSFALEQTGDHEP